MLLTPDQERRVTETPDEDYEDDRALGGEAKVLDGDNQCGRISVTGTRRCAPSSRSLWMSTPDFTSAQFPQIYDDLENLHSLGILIGDIHPIN